MSWVPEANYAQPGQRRHQPKSEGKPPKPMQHEELSKTLWLGSRRARTTARSDFRQLPQCPGRMKLKGRVLESHRNAASRLAMGLVRQNCVNGSDA